MTERDEFDKIVEGLDLDLDVSFPDEPADPVRRLEPPPALVWSDDTEPVEQDEEEPFYRKVEPTPLVPRRRSVLLAWIGVLGAPLALALAGIFDIYLGPTLVSGAALIFVAAGIFLILQLPEHGPARKDWPDDGAVL